MNISLNTEGLVELAAFVAHNCAGNLNYESFVDDINLDDGHLEIKGRYTKTGNPVTMRFTESCFDTDLSDV